MKTWRQKYETRKEPEVAVLEKPFAGMQPGQRMLISTPAEIEAYLRAIPANQAVNVLKMREDLAAKHDAEVTCPATTSIFLRIVSEIALEEMKAGKDPSEVTPFWRVVEAKSPLAKKLSCGPEQIQALRAAERLP